jgi:hypothetical protein
MEFIHQTNLKKKMEFISSDEFKEQNGIYFIRRIWEKN